MTLDNKKLLQGYYEAEHLPRDFSDNRVVPSYAYNVLNPLGLLYRPIVDEDYISKNKKKPEWPDGKSFAVCLTHDVDDVSLFSLTQALRAYRKPFGGLDLTVDKLKRFFGLGLNTAQAFKNIGGYDPLHCYERWLEIEKEFHAKSTFFFWPGWRNVTRHHHSDPTYDLNDRLEFDGQKCSVVEMIREICRRGWEIGLHPSWYSFNNKDELMRQKEALENALEESIFSVRQHFLHYDIRKTPRMHFDAGFKFDSTLGFNDNIGFRFGTCYPWKLYDILNREPLPILEIPLIIQDAAMLHQSKGMRIDHLMAFDYFVLIARRVEKVGGVLTLLWHPNEIINQKSWQLYLRILDYIREKKAWITSVQEIGNWWLR